MGNKNSKKYKSVATADIVGRADSRARVAGGFNGYTYAIGCEGPIDIVIYSDDMNKCNNKSHQNNLFNNYNSEIPIISINGNQCWYRQLADSRVRYANVYSNNVFHRDNDLPAVIDRFNNKFWYRNGKLHRSNGLPAVVRERYDDIYPQFEYWVRGERQYARSPQDQTPDFCIQHHTTIT